MAREGNNMNRRIDDVTNRTTDESEREAQNLDDKLLRNMSYEHIFHTDKYCAWYLLHTVFSAHVGFTGKHKIQETHGEILFMKCFPYTTQESVRNVKGERRRVMLRRIY